MQKIACSVVHVPFDRPLDASPRALFYSVNGLSEMSGCGLDQLEAEDASPAQGAQRAKVPVEVKAMGAILMEIVDSRVMPNYQ